MALTDRRHAQTAQGGTTAATLAPSPRRVPQVGAGAVLALQRSAGNTAVVQHLRPSVVAQRARIDLPAGGSVGDASASNGREAVLLVLKRLYGLWAIETKDFDQTFPAVEAMPSGTMVTEKPVLDVIDKAVVRLEEPTLAAQVALAQFSLPIGAGVGQGQPNRPADVADLQDLLHVRWHLSDDDYGREHGAATSGAPLSESSLSATFAGITKLKREAAAGTGKPGWSPLIRSDEAGGSGPGGQDRFADRTFSFGEFMIFVPSAATKGLSNFVHVFFSAAGVLDASSHVEHHGLRAAAETGGWILFGVQGEPGKAFTIGEAQVRAGLESIGRPGQIAAVRLSAHSRGNSSMARTLSLDPQMNCVGGSGV
jgi:hypothetical protein